MMLLVVKGLLDIISLKNPYVINLKTHIVKTLCESQMLINKTKPPVYSYFVIFVVRLVGRPEVGASGHSPPTFGGYAFCIS